MKQPRIDAFVPKKQTTPELKSSLEHMPVIEKPQPQGMPPPSQPVPPGGRGTAPPPVPQGVPPTAVLVPKVRRPIRQRQPFDIYEDQYKQLKSIAAAEKDFVNGRGMSQMVRDAIDQYLRDHASAKK